MRHQISLSARWILRGPQYAAVSPTCLAEALSVCPSVCPPVRLFVYTYNLVDSRSRIRVHVYVHAPLLTTGVVLIWWKLIFCNTRASGCCCCHSVPFHEAVPVVYCSLQPAQSWVLSLGASPIEPRAFLRIQPRIEEPIVCRARRDNESNSRPKLLHRCGKEIGTYVPIDL